MSGERYYCFAESIENYFLKGVFKFTKNVFPYLRERRFLLKLLVVVIIERNTTIVRYSWLVPNAFPPAFAVTLSSKSLYVM